jgi:hypothetical protein
MTHKEFCIWLDGFLTNSDWTTIKENDIETIKRKLKSVNKTFSDFNHPPTPRVSPYVVPTNPKNSELERLINLQNDINANNN